MTDLEPIVRRGGFAFVRGPEMRGILEQYGSLSDWTEFARSWNDLGLDSYMADGGRYRKRRHACFSVSVAGIVRKPHQPHYQSRDYNPLNGGIARWFEPVNDEIGSAATMLTILRFCQNLFDRLTPVPAWHVEMHQFRIEARPGELGKPTPEGTHQDGVDHVLVLLIGRENVCSGETTVTDLARKPLGSFTLTESFDSALVDDNRVMHGVTPIEPVDPSRAGHRDVLVVTFRRA